MEVKLEMKEWKIEKDKKTGAPVVTGTYDIRMNGKSIATQRFNGDYSDTTLPFSGDLVQRLMGIEKEIIAEIVKLVQ